MALAKHEEMVEQFAPESADKALGEGVHVGVRTAVRTTLVPTASNRLANRAPSLASRSTTSTSGWTSKVAFRACCAHQSSDGARVTAACMILRLFRSRKNRTKIGRKSTSKVCTKSQAQVTWLRRKVLQRWPSPQGTRLFMYRCTVRFETRIPSLSSSPRSRSAPHLGFRAAISRISVAKRVGLRPGVRDRHRHRRRNPSRCHRSTVAGCTSVTAARQEAVHLVRSAIVKRCEPVNITRLRCRRLFAAASCCLRSSFSARSDARQRNCPTTNPTRAPSIVAEYQEERPLEQDRRGSRK